MPRKLHLIEATFRPLFSALKRAVFLYAFIAGANQILAETNQLTSNASFETPGNFVFYHGPYSLPGWQGNNKLFASHRVIESDATDGKRCLHMDWAGTIATAPEARAQAIPGLVYQMRYDLRTLIGKYPGECLGTISYLEFYDADGKLIKKYWGPEWFPQSQAEGAHPWENISVRGVAPAGTVSVGVRVEAPSGTFYNKERNLTENRHIELDNFQLTHVAEAKDRLALRRFPRLVEPGKDAILAIHHAATAPGILKVGLMDKQRVLQVEAIQPVTTGRALSIITVSIPKALPAGDYAWELSLVTQKSSVGLREENVFCDEQVSLPTNESTVLEADHPNIVLMGRWDAADRKHPWMHWFASEIRIRFNGSSLTLLGSPLANTFGGTKAVTLQVVIDGDESNVRVIQADKLNGVIPLATDLTRAVHTARIFKASESGEPFRLDGFRFDAGCGLLRPEPLPARRLEIYGDSVTSGGSASPSYFGYAPLLGRELNADVHVISKGGTGVAASFSHLITLPRYWDRLSCENLFNASKSPKWDFSSWTPDAVVVAIGHNDQFNNGTATFKTDYADFMAGLRGVYPKAPILGMNTVISAPVGHFQKAWMPLLSRDSQYSFAFQWFPWSDPKAGHPLKPAHAAMVHGDSERFSLAEWVENKLGWGLDMPNEVAR